MIAVLWQDYPEQAAGVMARYLAHMRRNAFTQGDAFGAPWSASGGDGAANQNAVFGPSIAMPYSVLAREG